MTQERQYNTMEKLTAYRDSLEGLATEYQHAIDSFTESYQRDPCEFTKEQYSIYVRQMTGLQFALSKLYEQFPGLKPEEKPKE